MPGSYLEHSRVSAYEQPWDHIYRPTLGRLTGLSNRKILFTTWNSRKKKFEFGILRPDKDDIDLLGESPNPIEGGLESIASELEEIARFLQLVSSTHYHREQANKSRHLNLQGIGEGLFKRLISPELRNELNSWPSDTWVRISSNERWVPWELLHDGQEFLGERFMLFRYPRAQTHGAAAKHTQSDATVIRKIVNVVGGERIAGQFSPCEQLFGKVATDVVVKSLRGITVAELVEEIRDADVVHLTCHGYRDPLRLQISSSDDPSINLTLPSIEASNFYIKNGCLVFANACSSATPEPRLGEFLNFGWGFFLKGAAAFIGTLGVIPTDAALTFGKEFYEVLTDEKNNGDICRAYQIAKQSIKKDGIAHLLYCIYGNPINIPALNLR